MLNSVKVYSLLAVRLSFESLSVNFYCDAVWVVQGTVLWAPSPNTGQMHVKDCLPGSYCALHSILTNADSGHMWYIHHAGLHFTDEDSET